MKLTVQPTTSLKESLVSKGFLFPCGGKGVCGRCRIIAPTLPETALDHRFLTEFERANGWRLACDKHIDTPTEIDCQLQKGTQKKVEDPTVTALLTHNAATIVLTDGGEEAERMVAELNVNASGKEILAAIQKNSIELYEKHGVAKAVTIGIFGSAERLQTLYPFCDPASGESYDATELTLPSEEGYLAPTLPAATAPVLAAAVTDRTPVLYIDGDTVYLLAPSPAPLAAVLRLDGTTDPARVINAAMARLDPDGDWKGYGILPEGLTGCQAAGEVIPALIEAQSARRTRAAMQRLAAAVTPVLLAEDDEFQRLLSR